ncbi:MAG: 4Fe-4S binding protein [Candidatus Bathyarchaeota archaeon]|nr:4Fe-4S binding protein [Candidatus Termiticorpusculum sp.]
MSKQQDKGWRELPMAAVSQKVSTDFLTGDWKTFKPVLDSEKCVTCLTCAMLCPEGTICWDSKLGKITFNLDYCKGCGICANECPKKAIAMKMPAKDECEE